MSVLLSVARTRVKKYMDDVDGKVADSDTVLDAALEMAVHSVYLQASMWATQRFAKESDITTSAIGVGDLSTLDPVRIVAVNVSSGQQRLPVPALSLMDGPTNVLGVQTLKVLHVPKITFPTVSSDPIVWGQSSLDLPILDDLACLHAASHLTMLQDQGNKQLEARLKVLEEKAQGVLNFSTWRVMPLRSRSGDSGLGYVMTDAVTLQLVRL
jgi:hypothetical protein